MNSTHMLIWSSFLAQRKQRLHKAIWIAFAVGLLAGGVGPTRSDECLAPAVEVHMKMSAPPTCDQKWRYHIMRWLVIAHVTQQRQLIDAYETAADDAYNFESKVNAALGTVVSVLLALDSNNPDTVFDLVYATSDAALNVAPTDGSTAAELGRDIIGLMRTALYVSTKSALAGGALGPGTVVPVLAHETNKLRIRLKALWRYQNVLRYRNALLLQQEYLTEFFRLGGDEAAVAALYGAPANSSLEDVVRSMAKKMGYNRFFGRAEYDLDRAVQAIAWLKRRVFAVAEHCMQSGCQGISNLEKVEWDKLAAKYQEEAGRIKAKHDAEWDSYKAKYQEEADSINAKHDAEWQDYKTKYRLQQDAIRERHEPEEKAALHAPTSEQSEVRARHFAEWDSFRALRHEEQDAIRGKHAAEWDRFRARRHEEQDAIRGKHAAEWDSFRAKRHEEENAFSRRYAAERERMRLLLQETTAR